MTTAYSPLRYPGGKARLADFLIGAIAHTGLNEPDYVEPYAGGSGAALRLLFEEYAQSITINDADPRIFCFWKAVTRWNDAFANRVHDVDVSIDEWRRQREIYLACNRRKSFELGFATFFLNRTTRSGIIHNAGPIGGYEQTGNYKIDARFNKADLCARIQRIGMYADRIVISMEDGLTLLRDLNKQPKKAARTFVYLDPPYYKKGSELYLNQMSHDEHKQLARYLQRPKRFPWIMTYDNVEEIRTIYKEFTTVSFSLDYTLYSRREGHELLIHPDNLSIPHELRDLLPRAA